jgi:hypothetical protein
VLEVFIEWQSRRLQGRKQIRHKGIRFQPKTFRLGVGIGLPGFSPWKNSPSGDPTTSFIFLGRLPIHHWALTPPNYLQRLKK